MCCERRSRTGRSFVEAVEVAEVAFRRHDSLGTRTATVLLLLKQSDQIVMPTLHTSNDQVIVVVDRRLQRPLADTLTIKPSQQIINL